MNDSTRDYLEGIAEGLDNAPRITIEDGSEQVLVPAQTARMLADRARLLIRRLRPAANIYGGLISPKKATR